MSGPSGIEFEGFICAHCERECEEPAHDERVNDLCDSCQRAYEASVDAERKEQEASDLAKGK